MIKNFQDFLVESDRSNSWIVPLYMKFVWECNDAVIKETESKFIIIRDEGRDKDILMTTKGSQSMIHCLDPEGKPYRSGTLKPGEYWTVEWSQWVGISTVSVYPHGTVSPQNLMLDHGWFGLSITPHDAEFGSWFTVYYELKGTKFVPVNYDNSHSDMEIRADANDRRNVKAILGENMYLAQSALREGKLPRGVEARKLANVWMGILKKLPELDLTAHKGKVMGMKYGI